MATIEIQAITKTPERALAYIMKDKILKYSPEMKINPDNPYKIIEENGKKYVEFFTLHTNQFCDFLNPINTYKELQSHWQTSGIVTRIIVKKVQKLSCVIWFKVLMV